MKSAPNVLILCVLSAVALCSSARSDALEPKGEPVRADVVVVGAGSAGVPAAVQAGRAGVKTILIESGSQPGGAATSGGVNFPGLFHAWGKQVIAGIGWEWVVRTTELSGAKLPDFTQPTGRQHWRHQIRGNIPIYVAVAEELLREANVEVRYFEAPADIRALGEDSEYNWRIITAAQGELRSIECRQLIDCTGNGAVVALAGGERMREEETQPGTFNYKLVHHIDLAKADKNAIQKRYADALASGELLPGDARGGILSFLGNSENNYVYGADSSTAESRSRTNMAGRAAMLRMLRFVKSLPGGEDATIAGMSPETGVRETYRVVGEYMITAEDYRAGKRWDDSLAYAFYPIDLHVNQTGVQPKHLEEGIVPTIPRRALLVKGVPNLQAAGRCISSDRLANSALRVQASCMASGQAAGAIAAAAVKKGVAPGEVDLDEVKALLKEAGAIVP